MSESQVLLPEGCYSRAVVLKVWALSQLQAPRSKVASVRPHTASNMESRIPAQACLTPKLGVFAQ